MRYANLIPHSHIARGADPRLTADTRRAFTTMRAAVVAATESAKRFARTEPLVSGDGSFDRSAIMRAAISSARARVEVTGDAWGVCMSYALKGAWAAAKGSHARRVH